LHVVPASTAVLCMTAKRGPGEIRGRFSLKTGEAGSDRVASVAKIRAVVESTLANIETQVAWGMR